MLLALTMGLRELALLIGWWHGGGGGSVNGDVCSELG